MSDEDNKMLSEDDVRQLIDVVDQGAKLAPKKEMRKNKRVEAALACSITLSINNKKQTIHGSTIDVSSRGAGIVFQENISVNKKNNIIGKIDYSFCDRNEELIFVGHIVNKIFSNDEFRYSVIFDKFDKGQILLFSNYIDWKLEQMAR